MPALTGALAYLRELRDHNSPEWFHANRATYDAARAAFLAFVREIHAGLAEADPLLRTTDPAKALFRINRDVRFSADKAPYKRHFSAALAPGGRKDPGPVYYLHLQPDGESGYGGGVWLPESADLKRIRQEIDFTPAPLRTLLAAPDFRRWYGPELMPDGALKRIPAGYPPDHPDADLLRLKSFTAWHPVPDGAMNVDDAVTALNNLIPLVEWLRGALHT